MLMSGHMDKSQGFTFLYASFYPSISVGVPIAFNQTGEKIRLSKMIHLSHIRNRISKHCI